MLSEYSFFVFVNLAIGFTVGNDIICVSKRLYMIGVQYTRPFSTSKLYSYKCVFHTQSESNI